MTYQTDFIIQHSGPDPDLHFSRVRTPVFTRVHEKCRYSGVSRVLCITDLMYVLLETAGGL